jgi:hypothetical protein
MPGLSRIFRWPVKVLIAGDLAGGEDSKRHEPFLSGDPVESIRHELCQFYAPLSLPNLIG